MVAEDDTWVNNAINKQRKNHKRLDHSDALAPSKYWIWKDCKLTRVWRYDKSIVCGKVDFVYALKWVIKVQRRTM